MGLGLRVPKIWGFPLTLIFALTTVLRTTVLHCDEEPYAGMRKPASHCFKRYYDLRVKPSRY